MHVRAWKLLTEQIFGIKGIKETTPKTTGVLKTFLKASKMEEGVMVTKCITYLYLRGLLIRTLRRKADAYRNTVLLRIMTA